MINGFTEQTEQLSDRELSLVPGFVKGMYNHVGKENAITNSEMIEAYRRRDIKITAPRIRAIINHIRLTGQVKNLIADSDGYYIARTPKEVEDYVISLKQRAGAIMAVAESYRI